MFNSKTIQVMFKTIYCQDLIYPVCEEAKTFAEMLKQKTLTDRDIQFIKRLGYTIEVVTNKPRTL